jgi:imidazolonepropionase-like amidohydrolase
VLRFLSPSGRQACRGTVSSVLRVAPSIRDSLFAAFRRDVARLHAAGARLLAGTDVGNPCLVPGESLLRELELLVEAGLSPTAALRTATTNVGDMLRRPDVGHLGAGARADLVLVRENPLLDITRMRDVAGVVAGGRYLSPARLDALRAAATIP